MSDKKFKIELERHEGTYMLQVRSALGGFTIDLTKVVYSDGRMKAIADYVVDGSMASQPGALNTMEVKSLNGEWWFSAVAGGKQAMVNLGAVGSRGPIVEAVLSQLLGSWPVTVFHTQTYQCPFCDSGAFVSREFLKGHMLHHCSAFDRTPHQLAMVTDNNDPGDLPVWAERLSDGNYMEAGAQLCTSDGRVVGNAVVLSVELSKEPEPRPVAHVGTDAGHDMHLFESEMASLFHRPRLIVKTGRWPVDLHRHTGVVLEEDESPDAVTPG